MDFVKGLEGKIQGNICKREGSRSFCFGLGDISEHSVYASWTELSFADHPLCPLCLSKCSNHACVHCSLGQACEMGESGHLARKVFLGMRFSRLALNLKVLLVEVQGPKSFSSDRSLFGS